MTSSEKSRKTLSVSLTKDIFEALQQMWIKASKKNKKFGGFINYLLAGCIRINNSVSSELLEKLFDENYDRFLHKYFDVLKEVDKEKEIMREYIQNRMENTVTKLLGVRSKSGTILNKDEFEALVESAFKAKSDLYVATTILVPSLYRIYIGQYLNYHESALVKEKLTTSIRIMAVPERDLFLDYNYDPYSFKFFIDWHYKMKKKNDLKLFQVDPIYLDELISHCKIKPYSRTLSIWQNCYSLALRYKHPHEWKGDIVEHMLEAQLAYPSDDYYRGFYYDGSHELATKIKEAIDANDPKFKDILKIYEDFKKTEIAHGHYTDDLLKHWPEIVGTKREEKTIPFIEEIIKKIQDEKEGPARKELSILDAAGGLGSEVIGLCLSRYNEVIGLSRYNIVYNEPEPSLYRESLDWMVKNGKIESFKDNPTNVDNFRLVDYKVLNVKTNISLKAYNFPFNRLKYIFEEKSFGLVLAIGNILPSLDFTDNPKNNEMKELKGHLNDLIILGDSKSCIIFDIRNFDRMRDSLQKSETESYLHFIENKYYSSKYVYTGSIIGAPLKIINGKIEFVYYDTNTKKLINTFSDSSQKNSKVIMYDLKPIDIYNCIKDNKRVKKIQMFFDYNMDNKIEIDLGQRVNKKERFDEETITKLKDKSLSEHHNDYFVFVLELTD